MKVVKILILSAVFFLINPNGIIAQSCNCKEYIYLNEPPIGSVLKFEVGSSIVLTEVVGSNGGPYWYPGTGVSEMPSPHGLGYDLNGNLYIGANDENDRIRKFNCDGQISPISPSTITTNTTNQNIFSIGNILYHNSYGGPTAYNTCDGSLVGKVCFNNAAGIPIPNKQNWGLSYNETTQMVYATSRDVVIEYDLDGNLVFFGADPEPNNRNLVWAFSKAQLDDAIANGTCINPIIVGNPSQTVNPGDNFIPNITGSIMGITSDNAGNMYIVKSALDSHAPLPGEELGSFVYKYNAAGQYVSQSPLSPLDGAYGFAIGIVWSENTNRLYVSNFTDAPAADCISVFNPQNMAYIGTAAPNPNLPINNTAKAIAIIKECCPSGLPSSFTKYICGGNGAKFYLNQEAFNTCDGIVCGSSWVPTSLSGMTFDPCDNSVTVTGNGCSTFTLDIAGVISTSCPPQTSVFTICNSLPPTITVNVSSPCDILNNHHSISGSISMPAPPLAGTMTLSVTGGLSQTYNAPFIMPINYSFTGLNSDGNLKTVTASFSDAPSCNSSISYMSPPECLCNISAQTTALECLDNGTPTKISDNRIRFNALITNNNSNLANYNVSINGGTTITPNTNVPYGVTQFLLGPGTAGGGATFTVTVTDSATPGCTQTFQVVDPGNCTPSTPSCPPIKCGTATIQVNGN